ncbi:TPA: MOP flippase family protein [Klebsiella aerogenes]|uniref:MOP flippase family protein n=3 Tax=Klebsiella aerogenes TaxID=548 RepID=UPI0004481108|nr:MOP flippase family protein [Klebsiella aerogenes]EIV6182413.1 MOP flippase family protein [Klebsiella aerogenes]EIV6707787.1 MOP flippase family protein [Klebsiella aerogenes]EIV9528940.1 MOP flippase family protein [Klebsiella aerogenes]EIW8606892.1 MOP flippase family protein [Klebsiella aerogenes]EKU8841966.1 MOP flippase family protein [Klebsiella aerogenes]
MSLREKTVNGAKWSAIATVASIGISFLQITLLARIIEPHQFGLLTISMLVIMIADTISDFGISNSIIQRKNISEVELSTLYWINVMIGLLVFFLVFVLSGLISDLLNQPEIKPLVQLLAFAFIIIPHGQQFRALLQKELEFSKIGLIETSSILIGFAITMCSALYYPFAITAIWGYLCMSICKTLMFAVVGRKIYKPILRFNYKSVSSNIKFGAYLTADALVNQLNSNIATVILSRSLGAVIAGGYNLAYNVAVLPPSRLNPILTRVLFPAFSKIQDDKEKLRTNFYKLLSFVGLINFPVLLGLLTVSDNFVITIFGEKWQFITPILQILCIVGLLRSIGNPIGSLLMAKARVDISFKFNVFKLFLFIPSIWIGATYFGGIGAALGFLIVQVINTYLSYFILIKPVLGSSYREYIQSITLPLVLTIPTVVVAWLVGTINISPLPVIMLILQVSSGVITFAITLVFSRNDFVREIKQQVVKNPKLRRLLRA